MPNYRAAARRAARRYGLDPGVFARQIQQESGFNPKARSPAGAQGIAQIMPATARGWGVDPSDPIASLDAAAKNMAKYVRQYGGYENALRAYNAGPGAIERSKGFSETNHYVSTILRGTNPSTRGVRSGGGGGGGSTPSPGRTANVAELLSSLGVGGTRQRPSVTAPAAPAFSAQAATPEGYAPPQVTEQKAQFDYNAALDKLAELAGQQRADQQLQRIPGAEGAGGGDLGEIRELFWNGPGAVNIDEGKRVGKSFVSGHTDHVHLAADRQTMRRAADTAESMGLNVGEYGRGIRSGHATGSFHYQPFGAMDVSGDTRKMRRFAKRVSQGRI